MKNNKKPRVLILVILALLLTGALRLWGIKNGHESNDDIQYYTINTKSMVEVQTNGRKFKSGIVPQPNGYNIEVYACANSTENLLEQSVAGKNKYLGPENRIQRMYYMLKPGQPVREAEIWFRFTD